MNERIRKLAEQAGAVFTEEHATSLLDDEIEKFALLIVKECARVARATPCPDFHESLKQQLGHTWDMASLASGKQIVEHFGVGK